MTASGWWRSTRRVDREVDDRSLSLSHWRVSEGAVLAGSLGSAERCETEEYLVNIV